MLDNAFTIAITVVIVAVILASIVATLWALFAVAVAVSEERERKRRLARVAEINNKKLERQKWLERNAADFQAQLREDTDVVGPEMPADIARALGRSLGFGHSGNPWYHYLSQKNALVLKLNCQGFPLKAGDALSAQTFTRIENYAVVCFAMADGSDVWCRVESGAQAWGRPQEPSGFDYEIGRVVVKAVTWSRLVAEAPDGESA